MPFFWDVMLYHRVTRPHFEKTHCLHPVMQHHTIEEGDPKEKQHQTQNPSIYKIPSPYVSVTAPEHIFDSRIQNQ